MSREQRIQRENYRDRELVFQKLESSKRFNPFEKRYEKRSELPTIRYSLEEQPVSNVYRQDKIRHSQGSYTQNNPGNFDYSNPRASENFYLGAKTMLEEKKKKQNNLLRTDSKVRNSKKWLRSPYKIASSNASIGISSKRLKTKITSDYVFSQSSDYNNQILAKNVRGNLDAVIELGKGII